MKIQSTMMTYIFKKTSTLLMLFMSTTMLIAQDEAVVVHQQESFWTIVFNNIILILAVVVFLAGTVAIYNLISKLMELQKLQTLADMGVRDSDEIKSVLRESSWSRFYNWMTSLVPLEKESTIDLGHNYDGIRELDNKLPPWWLGMMYGSILWAVVYMYYYHWSGNEWSSEGEYIEAMEEGEAVKNAFLDKMANQVNANTVVLLDDEQSLAQGKEIYDLNCVACHGPQGQGTVGPNFTDDYWIHGGSLKDIFTVISNGVVEKGMIAWKTQLRPVNIQQVASYISTMKGTNPPNPKDPEGTLYIPEDNDASNEGAEDK